MARQRAKAPTCPTPQDSPIAQHLSLWEVMGLIYRVHCYLNFKQYAKASEASLSFYLERMLDFFFFSIEYVEIFATSPNWRPKGGKETTWPIISVLNRVIRRENPVLLFARS